MQALLGVLAALVGIAGHMRASCFTNPPPQPNSAPKGQFKERPPRRVVTRPQAAGLSCEPLTVLCVLAALLWASRHFISLRSLRGRLSKAVRRGSEGGQVAELRSESVAN